MLTKWRWILGLGGLCVLGVQIVLWAQVDAPRKLDPAGWGKDHVGHEVPEYMTGGECLFCHGKNVGGNWQKNPHHLTVRPLQRTSAPAVALQKHLQEGEKAEYLLGSEEVVRFLRKGKGYGKAEIHSHWWNVHTRKLVAAETPAWDKATFGKRCAGCHATGVDSELQAFSGLTIDCCSCHGEMNPGHTKDPALMLLSGKGQDHPRVVTSICASCHIRTGKSRSTGLPYPNNFVPGDNLFRDFMVSFESSALAKLNPGDRHVLENIRDVVVHGKEEVTCLSCHDVHRSSTRRHRKLPKSLQSCRTCHESKGGNWVTREYEVHSPLCRY